MLMIGTIHLRVTISTERFIANVAAHLRSRDPAFSPEEALDFILRVFVEGSVQGKGTRLTEEQRDLYFRRLDQETFLCHHTGLPVHFFVSFLFEMASPDRYVTLD